MASYLKASADKSVVTWIGRTERDYVLLTQDEALRGLECGAGRICTLQSAVEKRLIEVGNQFVVVLASVASHEQTRVVCRTADHCENLSGGRLNGHDGTDFVGHQLLSVLLEVDVD